MVRPVPTGADRRCERPRGWRSPASNGSEYSLILFLMALISNSIAHNVSMEQPGCRIPTISSDTPWSTYPWLYTVGV